MAQLLRNNAHAVYYGLLLTSMALVLFAGWVSVKSALSMREAIDDANHSEQIIEQVHEVLVTYGETESFGLRWAVTLDDASWERFSTAMDRLDERADRLNVLVSAQPKQSEQARAILTTVRERHAHGRHHWPEIREQGVGKSLELIRSGLGIDLGDRIRIAAEELVRIESERRLERDSALKQRVQDGLTTVVVAIGLAIVAGLIGVLATSQARRAWVREREAEFEREKAEAASEQKSLFLATMSHEIRTPMNAIFGFSELLSRRVHDAKALEYVRAIRGSGQALLALINDLLDLSKIEAGRMELQQQPTDMRELIDSTLGVFAEAAAGKGLRLTADTDPFLPKQLVVDPHRLRQVLLNLLSNAVKYTDRGQIKLSVLAARADGSRANVTIRVQDTGSGIPTDQLTHIFEAFHRVLDARSGNVEGTGLGLAIVRRLVELMGGVIGVESVVGQGSVFTVQLPGLRIAHPSSPGSHARRPSADFSRLAPSRILVVDDVPLNRELLGAYLVGSGHEIEFAADGREAVAKASAWKPTLILMDLRMPNMDGREAAVRIRKSEETRSVCVVAVTASSTSGEDSDERLFDAYLRKPVSPQELFDCLRGLVGMKHDPQGCALPPDGVRPSESTDAGEGGEVQGEGDPEQWKDALDQIDGMISARLDYLKANMRMRELRIFAEDLACVSVRGGLPRVRALADRLLAAVHAFDVTSIDSLLDQLPRHVDAERRSGGEGS